MKSEPVSFLVYLKPQCTPPLTDCIAGAVVELEAETGEEKRSWVLALQFALLHQGSRGLPGEAALGNGGGEKEGQVGERDVVITATTAAAAKSNKTMDSLYKNFEEKKYLLEESKKSKQKK